VRPLAESSISLASRRSRVSSLFALTTHQTAALRYEGGRAVQKSQAARLARRRSSYSAGNYVASRCSYE
jgi:hypothetical protein